MKQLQACPNILWATIERYWSLWWMYFTFSPRAFSIVTTPPVQRCVLC